MAIKIHHANSYGNGSMLTVVPVVGDGFIFTINPQNSKGAAFAGKEQNMELDQIAVLAVLAVLVASACVSALSCCCRSRGRSGDWVRPRE